MVRQPRIRIGRGCKVGKEEIAGLVAAVEHYVKRDHRAEMQRWESIIAGWERQLRNVHGLSITREAPESAGNVPYLCVNWNEQAGRLQHAEFIRRLREGRPRVELWTTSPNHGSYLTPFMLAQGEE